MEVIAWVRWENISVLKRGAYITSCVLVTPWTPPPLLLSFPGFYQSNFWLFPKGEFPRAVLCYLGRRHNVSPLTFFCFLKEIELQVKAFACPDRPLQTGNMQSSTGWPVRKTGIPNLSLPRTSFGLLKINFSKPVFSQGYFFCEELAMIFYEYLFGTLSSFY